MAKKSLKKRIDDLIDALGRAEKPAFAEIRSELVSCRTLAESLEDGQALAEKDARIADLEAELGSLKIELQTSNAEIERFVAERKKQENKKREIPQIQFQILSRLPSKNGIDLLRIDEIARAVSIPLDEAEIHIDQLREAGLSSSRYNSYDASVWYRTMEGNKLIVARRLAGEEDQKTANIPILGR